MRLWTRWTRYPKCDFNSQIYVTSILPSSDPIAPGPVKRRAPLLCPPDPARRIAPRMGRDALARLGWRPRAGWNESLVPARWNAPSCQYFAARDRSKGSTTSICSWSAPHNHIKARVLRQWPDLSRKTTAAVLRGEAWPGSDSGTDRAVRSATLRAF